jgi:hypothetical protein
MERCKRDCCNTTNICVILYILAYISGFAVVGYVFTGPIIYPDDTMRTALKILAIIYVGIVQGGIPIFIGIFVIQYIWQAEYRKGNCCCVGREGQSLIRVNE